MREPSIASWDSLAASGSWTKRCRYFARPPRAPSGLAELCAATGLPRATAHRLAVGLEVHGLLARDANGRWRPGPMLAVLAAGAPDLLVAAGADVLPRLRDRTGESVQIYRADGFSRICIAVAEPNSGLRDTVPLGARLPMTAGSGAKVLDRMGRPGHRPGHPAGGLLHRAGSRRGTPAWMGAVDCRAGDRRCVGIGAGPEPAGAGHRRGLGVRPGGTHRPALRGTLGR